MKRIIAKSAGFCFGVKRAIDMALDAVTYPIETAEELCPRWLAKRERIGVTAGPSTPSWIIKEVERKVRHLKGLRG